MNKNKNICLKVIKIIYFTSFDGKGSTINMKIRKVLE